MTDIKKLFTAIIRFEADKQAIEKLSKDYQPVIEILRKADKAAEDFGRTLNEVNQIGIEMGDLGQSILTPFQTLSQSYVAQVGKTEAASARWLNSIQRIEAAQIRMGRAATKALQPMQDRLVKLSETAAAFVENNPGLVNAVANAGGLMLAAGTTLTIGTQIAKNIGQMYGLINQMRNLVGLSWKGVGVLGAATAILLKTPTLVKGAVNMIAQANPQNQQAQEYNAALQQQTGGDRVRTAVQTLGALVGGIALILRDLAKSFISYLKWANNLGAGLKTASALLLKQLYEGVVPALGKLAESVIQSAAFILHPFNEQKRKGVVAQATALLPQAPNVEAVLKALGLDKASIAKNAAAANSALEGAARGLDITVNDLGKILVDFGNWGEQMGRNFDAPSGDTGGANLPYTEQQLDEFADFLKEMTKAEADYQADRLQKIKDHNRALLEAEAELLYQRQIRDRERLYQESLEDRSFARDEKKALDAFNEERLDAEQAYRDEKAEAEKAYEESELIRIEDYHRQRERAEEDHRRNIAEAAARLDAIGVINAMKQRAIDKKRSDEDFSLESRRAKENQDKALRALDENYRQQEQLAKLHYAKQRAEALENFNHQRELAREAQAHQDMLDEEQRQHQQELEARRFQEQLDAEAKAHRDQMSQREKEYRDQLVRLQNHASMTGAEWDAYYSNLRAKLQAFISGALSIVPSGGGGSGGGGTGGGNIGQDPDPTPGYDDGHNTPAPAGTGLPGSRYTDDPLFLYFDSYYGKAVKDAQDKLANWFNAVIKVNGVPINSAAVNYYMFKHTYPMIPQYQQGGYNTAPGLAMLHGTGDKPEWIANANTTRAMERMAGGKLSQQSVLNMMGREISLMVNNNFENTGSHSIEALESMVGRVVRGQLIRLLSGA